MAKEHAVFYLRNIRIDDTIADDVALTAKTLKRDIRFVSEPMPGSSGDYAKGFGHIAVYDGKRDCSAFMRELKGKRNGYI